MNIVKRAMCHQKDTQSGIPLSPNDPLFYGFLTLRNLFKTVKNILINLLICHSYEEIPMGESIITWWNLNVDFKLHFSPIIFDSCHNVLKEPLIFWSYLVTERPLWCRCSVALHTSHFHI